MKKNLLVCVTGSIAAKLLYKMDEYFSHAYNVQYVLTDNAEDFVWATNEKNINLHKQIRYIPHNWHVDIFNDKQYDVDFCYNSKFNIWLSSQSHSYKTQYTKTDTDQQYYHSYFRVLHVDLAHWADKVLICPCSANTLAKIANKISDNLVTSIVSVAMGLQKPIYIAPAMNDNMYKNVMSDFNVWSLINKQKYHNIVYIPPTVDKLACGDFGIGALANIKTIFNIVSNKFWNDPIDWSNYVQNNTDFYSYECEGDWGIKLPIWPEFMPHFDEPGSFGAVRKHDIHTGVDLYCVDNANVHPVEPGEVVDIGIFTGEKVGSPWWNETQYVIVKGESGYVLYGEIEVDIELKVGDYIEEDDVHCLSDICIGTVKPVLKNGKQRPDIRNHSTSMLHIELYKEQPKTPVIWSLNTTRDKNLLDPTPYVWNFCY